MPSITPERRLRSFLRLAWFPRARRCCGIRARMDAQEAGSSDALRRPRQSAPRKPRRSGERVSSSGTVGGGERAGETGHQALRLGVRDEAGDAGGVEMGEKRACILVGGVEHDAGGAHVRSSGHGIEAGQCVGEQHEDEAHARRDGTKRLEAGLRVSAGKQPELDVVDTAGRALETAPRIASACIGRSPMVALTGTRPAIKSTTDLAVSESTAPSAPCAGSFRSMMSAPARRAISASATSRTLARKRVMTNSASCPPDAGIGLSPGDC